ncbi:SusD/RagB family nutrient-binding outer membrane lipoprotein [Dysgonomonas macrotermitis]|uniref:Susd and RagB outer membrane lipoprotein n=1 Tax=Dysgonomonas macrotermitis TaxID=1346286 RepID=A0A1M4VT60_9BACT|nr:SusD/RagB family nutrient-binding outer membrane lipoprotein [Dysgonomonas macrotermitis]SHE72224.1 Susd and RagB outer membrane lipoprotein [Dysgonomonas macrotermitis]
MKAHKYITIILLSFTTILFTQCTDAYDDYNKTGVNDDEGERDAYFLRQHMVNMQNWVIPSVEHANQFTEQLLGGPYGGYFADASPGFNNRNFSTYTPENAWIVPTFDNALKNSITSYNTIVSMTEDPIFLSVAKILKVMTMSRVTDVYGPVPYSQLGSTGALNAAYDSQEKIYETMISELNEAIEELTPNQTSLFSSKADRFYGGKVLNWIKLANSVKLRLAIRMADVKADLAKSTAESVINDPIGPITSNADNAVLLLISGQSNPYQTGMVEWNGGDSRISADITSYMNGYNDPRREKYFDVSEAFGGIFVGFRSGVTIPSPQATVQQYSNMSESMRKESSMRIMCAAETAFLRAEGALRGWSMGGTAKELYESGITLSFEQNGVSGAAAYIENNTNTPGRYIDPLDNFTFSGATSTVKIAWDNATSATAKETNLERIITQKWIAIFPNGIEAWTEFRRTGYPKLMPVITNNSSVVSTSRMARRLPYPQSEYTGNLTNVQYAVSNYLNGADNMATDLWWAKKN